MDPLWFWLAAGLSLAFGFIAMGVADERGRSLPQAFLLGALLGIIGVLIVAFLPKPKSPPAIGSPMTTHATRWRRIR